ncbi:hypothetical protein Cycma_4772 [Cyclobacterium marinum DSM 745]|uniref:Uncharacterized protein n=1 Tax=Cyclobacterium marinum (strain ATCC 25205 / DSM 745 / LMG 13164 / NCIMB 1802) TaxID=880070 RepID=G0J5K8_CYCMS|nr:hypothetical protein Cycma_4772 [Cyclobacterium marinum DSM 745]
MAFEKIGGSYDYGIHPNLVRLVPKQNQPIDLETFTDCN